MPGVKEQHYKSPYYNKGLHHEMKKHQEFNKVMNETQKKKPQRKWTQADQLFEDELWAS